MRKLQVLPILLLACALAATIALAGASGNELPFRFNPSLDGAPVYATDSTTGTTWTAWAYRWRGEFDIAISMRAPGGAWSDPTFIGRLDGLDQGSPALVSDTAGNLYLAFAVRQTSQVQLVALARGASAWSTPALVTSAGERGFTPALATVADRLVVAYRTADGKIALRERPLITEGIQPFGIADGPDGVDPLGVGGATPPNGAGGGTGVPGGGPTDAVPPAGGAS